MNTFHLINRSAENTLAKSQICQNGLLHFEEVHTHHWIGMIFLHAFVNAQGIWCIDFLWCWILSKFDYSAGVLWGFIYHLFHCVYIRHHQSLITLLPHTLLHANDSLIFARTQKLLIAKFKIWMNTVKHNHLRSS